MNYGLYLSASGVLANMYRQDVFANNLANVQTTGFKPDLATIGQRAPASIEGKFSSALRQQLLDKEGGGAVPGPQTIDFTPGALQTTGNALDVAIQTPDAFFAVQTKDAQGKTVTALTRDGRFSINKSGQLVTASGGKPVLDVNNRPIMLSLDAPATIEADGSVVQGGAAIAKLQVTGVSNMQSLTKLGGNLLGFSGKNDPRKPLANPPDLKTGAVESSSVDPIRTLTNLINATKAISDGGNLIHFHDQLMDRAINSLGRPV